MTETATVTAPAEETDFLAVLETEPEELEQATETDPRIKAFTDRGFRLTAEKPRKWFVQRLPESEVKKVARQAKKYARENGMVFRVKTVADPTMLVYCVTVKADKEAEAGE